MAFASSSSETPKAGFTSSRAFMKSPLFTFIVSISSATPATVPTFTWRLKANDEADLTKPPISAPEKFLVKLASSRTSTSLSMTLFSRIFEVWIFRICALPASSGREISM